MMDVPIYVIDFEGSRESGIVEYGVVSLFDEQIQDTYTGLCRPLGVISGKESNIHFIKNQDVEDKKLFEDQVEFFYDLRKKGVFCAHNSWVENGLLKRHRPYPGQVPDFLNGSSLKTWGPWLDTLPLFRYFYPQLDSYKLMDLVEVFGLKAILDEFSMKYCPELRRKPHCALYDALGSALLLQHLLELDYFKVSCLEKLFLYSDVSPEINQMNLI